FAALGWFKFLKEMPQVTELTLHGDSTKDNFAVGNAIRDNLRGNLTRLHIKIHDTEMLMFASDTLFKHPLIELVVHTIDVNKNHTLTPRIPKTVKKFICFGKE